MKRLAGLLLLSAGVLVAQAQEPLRFRGGLYAGVCASQIHGDGVSGFDKFGLTAGPLLEISRGDVAWEWGMLYTQKGSR